jgi:acyl carrier protein
MNFIELFNKVAKVARPAHLEFIPFTSMEERFTESSLDSLDLLMMSFYMCEIYDIDDETAKELNPETVQEFYDAIQLHKKRDPESIEWAMEFIK